jgi:NAD+ diphosphatase
VVLLRRGQLAVTADARALNLVGPDELPALTAPSGAAPPAPLLLAYLGRDARARYLAYVLGEEGDEERDFAGVPRMDAAEGDGRTWASLREVGADLDDRDAGLAATAVALAAWHSRHLRCPRCGGPTEPEEAGWVRRCPPDGTLHYPRTDPAVIVAVTDDAGDLLLAHAAHWPRARFSVVAGYVEPGESLEAAVRREVAEETGLEVGELSYEGSQPWPFPSSLMLGFRARVLAGRLQVDGEEVTEARFVSRASLGALVAAGEIVLPYRSSIARALIEEWYGGRLPGP